MQSIILRWTNPTADRDGSNYEQPDNAGYVVSLDGAPPFQIGLVWGTEFDVGSDVHLANLKAGSHTVAIANLSKKGVVGVFTPPATFSVHPVANAPGNFTVT